MTTSTALQERRKQRGEYFTADWLSSILVANINVKENVQSFVDLAAGRGSLLQAVRDRWQGIYGSTVEIDHQNHSYLRARFPDLNHINLSVYDNEFPIKFASLGGNKKSDVIVCNPPYQKLAMNNNILSILRYLKLDVAASNRVSVESEILFFIQALKTFPEGAELAAIVPDYLLTAFRTKYIRKTLIEYFGVYKVIEVPRKVFKSTEVKTHLIFLRLGQRSQGKIEISATSNIDESIYISPDEFEIRSDYSYYKTLRSFDITHKITLGDIASISRGNMPMYVAKRLKLRPFHTTDFKLQIEEMDNLYSSDDNFRTALRGDIFVARVGRGAGNQIASIDLHGINYSDCIFCISPHKDTDGLSDLILNQLFDHEVKEWINSRCKGSGAKSISLEDMYKIPIFGGTE